MLLTRFPQGAVPWAPNNRSKPLLAWWDAQSGISSSGGNLTSWTDRTTGKVLTVAGGSASYSSSAWNSSQPGVTLAVSLLTCTDATLKAFTGPYTAFAVVSATGTGSKVLFFWFNSGTFNGYGLGEHQSGTGFLNAIDRLDPTSISASNGGTIDARNHALWEIYDHAGDATSGALDTYVTPPSSTRQHDISAHTVAGGSFAPDTFYVGGTGIAGSLFTGVLAELMIYNGVLAQPEGVGFAKYAGAKWGGLWTV